MEIQLPQLDFVAVKQALRVDELHRTARTTVAAPRTLKYAEWPPDYDEALVWRRVQLARYETDPAFLDKAKRFYAKNCVAFINHWCDTYDPRNAGTDKSVWMPFILFERQAQLVTFILECLENEQPGLVEKARTMGATWVGVAVSVWAWLFIPGIAIGWGSRDSAALAVLGDPSSIFEKIRMLIRRLPKQFLPEGVGTIDDPVSGDNKKLKALQIINPANGATIIGQIGDNIGRGARTRLYFKDESAHYEHPEAIEAALSGTTRVPIDISSVNGLGNVFHRKREAGMDWYPGVKIPRGVTRVFVMDWSESPQYGKAWFEETRKYWEDQGMPHVFASEFERNYAASVQGTIIPLEWLEACIDAHVKLGIEPGPKISGLDIGDSQDGDRNAQSIRAGIILTYAEEWVARDPGVTARKAIQTCVQHKVPELQYDAGGGLGSNVKSQVNLLREGGNMPKVRVVPWNPGGKVLHGAEKVVPLDLESPRNKDFFTNLKAQAWWALRLRVFNTYQAITQGVKHDPDELFSIDSKLPLLQKVKKELCQATSTTGAKLKLLVDKAPEGTRSPNIADSIVMAYFPAAGNDGDFVDIAMGPKVFVNGELFR